MAGFWMFIVEQYFYESETSVVQHYKLFFGILSDDVNEIVNEIREHS